MLKRNVADNILSSGHDDVDDESRLSEAREEGGGDDGTESHATGKAD